MSILIKGIDMPKNGEITIAFASDENGENTMALIVDDKGKSVEHKGVTEIPTPHGRLIDADKAATSISMMNNHPCGNSIENVNDVVEWLRFVDENGNNIAFPTIIEAEVSE